MSGLVLRCHGMAAGVEPWPKHLRSAVIATSGGSHKLGGEWLVGLSCLGAERSVIPEVGSECDLPIKSAAEVETQGLSTLLYILSRFLFLFIIWMRPVC